MQVGYALSELFKWITLHGFSPIGPTRELHLFGMALLRELKLRGVQNIRLVNRSGQLPDDDKVQVIQGDASQVSHTIEICKGASVKYHCAQPGYLNWPKQFPALTKGILEGAAASGAKLIYADNHYMYGRVDAPLKENPPYRAKGSKGITRAKMAEEIMNRESLGSHRESIRFLRSRGSAVIYG